MHQYQPGFRKRKVWVSATLIPGLGGVPGEGVARRLEDAEPEDDAAGRFAVAGPCLGKISPQDPDRLDS